MTASASTSTYSENQIQSSNKLSCKLIFPYLPVSFVRRSLIYTSLASHTKRVVLLTIHVPSNKTRTHLKCLFLHYQICADRRNQVREVHISNSFKSDVLRGVTNSPILVQNCILGSCAPKDLIPSTDTRANFVVLSLCVARRVKIRLRKYQNLQNNCS